MVGAKIKSARALARRCGAYFALGTLTLQLALSFAHVHKHYLAFSEFDCSDVVSVSHTQSTQRTIEQLPSRLADDDDHCPICFSGFLLSSSWLPDVPENQHPLQFAEIDRAFYPASDSVFQPRHTAFLSRGPPLPDA